MQQILRKTFIFDAEGKILGRLASEIAIILQGKNRPDYRSNLDCGHFVEVKHVHGIKVSGRKAETKIYKHFSGYPSGMKEVSFKVLFAKNPQKVLSLAVLRMLPKNRLRSAMIKRLKFI